MRRIYIMMALGLVLFCLIMPSKVTALELSFRGIFVDDNEIKLVNFSVNVLSTVTLRTYSYAGGTQADGMVIDRGGFDPILTLFDAAGNFLECGDNGGGMLFVSSICNDDAVGVPVDLSGQAFDALISTLLATGDDYTVALTQHDNFSFAAFSRFDPVPETLEAGFFFNNPDFPGFPDFTFDLINSPDLCLNKRFCDTSESVDYTQRNGNWAFDISITPVLTQTVPEPGTWLLMGTGLAGLVGCRWRRRNARLV